MSKYPSGKASLTVAPLKGSDHNRKVKNKSAEWRTIHALNTTRLSALPKMSNLYCLPAQPGSPND